MEELMVAFDLKPIEKCISCSWRDALESQWNSIERPIRLQLFAFILGELVSISKFIHRI